jgi:hypothetical protein
MRSRPLGLNNSTRRVDPPLHRIAGEGLWRSLASPPAAGCRGSAHTVLRQAKAAGHMRSGVGDAHAVGGPGVLDARLHDGAILHPLCLFANGLHRFVPSARHLAVGRWSTPMRPLCYYCLAPSSSFGRSQNDQG